MKLAPVLALVRLAVLGPQSTLAGRVVPAHALELRQQQSPATTRVLNLIIQLRNRIKNDGQLEQESYDKYACWCEDVLGRKSKDISDAKVTIERSEALMKELEAEIATHGAEMKQLEADIAANVNSQREAQDMRQKEFSEYSEERTESEQCIGALEAAIAVLEGAGTGKKGFLETLQEAKLLSVVAGVRSLLKNPVVSRVSTTSDLEVVKHFVEKPEDFVGSTGVMSAAQIANNPFGDYAPQSTQIQGILKGMHDAFIADLEKANAEEAESQKAHEKLMATKEAELKTLQLTLEQHTLGKADKTKKLADTKTLRDDTQEQLKADEVFFADTKEACKVKASEWSERSRLRTEELTGINQAIQILSSPEAEELFKNASETLLQISADSVKGEGTRRRNKAFLRLEASAQKSQSLRLAKLAVQVKAAGHFDEVIASIDSMIALLRKEEQADIAHRDRCQNAEGKNVNDLEDDAAAIDKAGKTITRLDQEIQKLRDEITAHKEAINQTKVDMEEQLQLRNGEEEEFKQALQADAESVALLEQAIVVLSEFYRRNKIAMGLVQQRSDPEYSVDPDKAPETIWEGGNYGGRKSETEGIVAILGMIKEDLEKEMQTARADDTQAQAEYVKGRTAAQAMLDSQMALKAATEGELAETEQRKQDVEAHKSLKEGDEAAELELKDAIYSDCSWVSTHFESRRTKRKTELDGLVEAKGYLAGVDAGTELTP